MQMNELILLLIIGFIAGILGGMFGIGGGIVVIPALVFFMGFSQHEAQGTDLAFMLAPIGILATMNYYKKGFVNIKFAVILMISFVVGAYLGSMITMHIPDKILKKLFGIVLLYVSYKMIFKS